MLFKISKCPACKKIFSYFRIVKKNKAQPLKHSILYKTMTCSRCEQTIGVLKDKQRKISEIKWMEHESLEDDNLVYHDELNKLQKKLFLRIQSKGKKFVKNSRKQYFSKNFEKQLTRKVTSLRKQIDLKTKKDQMQLRADVALFLKNKSFKKNWLFNKA